MTKHFIVFLATELQFQASAVHNQTYVTISCEHPSARLSNTGIFIQDQNRLAECRWIGSQPICNKGATGLDSLLLFYNYLYKRRHQHYKTKFCFP